MTLAHASAISPFHLPGSLSYGGRINGRPGGESCGPLNSCTAATSALVSGSPSVCGSAAFSPWMPILAAKPFIATQRVSSLSHSLVFHEKELDMGN